MGINIREMNISIKEVNENAPIKSRFSKKLPRCKSSIRLNCPIRKKVKKKTYIDTKKKGESK